MLFKRCVPLLFGPILLAPVSTAVAADWVTFQDPIEKAFTMDVPQGWVVKGGLFRLGYSDYRPMVDLVSPDGKSNIRLGDISIPNYAVPDRLHPEGDTVDLGAQAQMTVSRYRTGEEYAAAYARVRFKESCTALTPAPLNGPPPAAPAADATARQSSTGEATYKCDASRAAYVYARTALYAGFWQVNPLASFVVPADQAQAARAILERALKSFHPNDAWVQYQKKLDEQALVYQQARQQARRRALSQQVAQFEMQMQAMQGQVAAFEHHQAAQAKQVETWGNILTGITPTTDPYGNTHNVWIGPKNGYWTDGRGNYLNSDLSPGPGWQRLTPKQ